MSLLSSNPCTHIRRRVQSTSTPSSARSSCRQVTMLMQTGQVMRLRQLLRLMKRREERKRREIQEVRDERYEERETSRERQSVRKRENVPFPLFLGSCRQVMTDHRNLRISKAHRPCNHFSRLNRMNRARPVHTARLKRAHLAHEKSHPP